MKVLFLTVNQIFPKSLLKHLDIDKENFIITDSINQLIDCLEKSSIIIIDMILPKHDAIEACTLIREKDLSSYIIIRSDEIENYTKIAAYKSGGNSFIPFNLPSNVLSEKIKSVYNLFFEQKNHRDYNYKEFHISYQSKEITIGNKAFELPKIQFLIFTLLTSNPGTVFSNQEIYDHAWGKGNKVDSGSLYVHLRGIRMIMGTNYIKTLRGIGYKAVI